MSNGQIRLHFLNIQSQEVAFNVGTNYTDYSFDANDDFEAGSCKNFETDFLTKFDSTKTDGDTKSIQSNIKGVQGNDGLEEL